MKAVGAFNGLPRELREYDFSVSVSDPGSGPDPSRTTLGLGTKLVDALTQQIKATITK
jgi:two-component sensor histidine kinase